MRAVLSNVWLHVHPTKVNVDALRFRFTMCAGGITFLLFLLLTLSGILLMFFYRPDPAHAYQDILTLTQEMPFGSFLRSVHRYAGDLMVIMAFVHMVRVFIAGAYRPPREFNWIVGVLLLVLTLAVSFTGYLLPWDQKGYWATTVASNLLAAAPVIGADGPAAMVSAERDLRALLIGGAGVGQATLLRFYILHCVLLPLCIALLMILHFWRVRKDGISRPL